MKISKYNRTQIMGFLSIVLLFFSLILCLLFLNRRIENYTTASILIGGSFLLLLFSVIFGVIGIIKPKKSLIAKVFCIIPLICISSCIYFSDTLIFSLFAEKLPNKNDDLINTGKVLNVDLSKGKYQRRIETHGGFLGDGEYYSRIIFTKDNDISESLNNNAEWNKLPLPKELSDLLFNADENHHFDLEIDKRIKIPNIQNGFYFFRNKQDVNNKNDASKIYNTYSFNLTIAIYDVDNYVLYYYELDT